MEAPAAAASPKCSNPCMMLRRIGFGVPNDMLKGKDIEEFNWALWPTLDPLEKIRTSSSLYNMAHDYQFADPWAV